MIYILRVVETAASAYHSYVEYKLSYGIIFLENSVKVNRAFVLKKLCLRSIFKIRKRGTCSRVFKQYNILTLPGLYYIYMNVLASLENVMR